LMKKLIARRAIFATNTPFLSCKPGFRFQNYSKLAFKIYASIFASFKLFLEGQRAKFEQNR
jgi:hypothetical protein